MSLRKTYYNILFLLLGLSGIVNAQEEITFLSADSLELTANLYFQADTLPYIVLLHEQGSSRGEFTSLAKRFQKMDYNCLAVDIRNGGSANFISNETVRRFQEGDFLMTREAVENDIRAAINYAFKASGQKVILLGSGATGSLCLKISTEMEEIKGVIALSPGEFFRPVLSIQDTISNLQKPVFAGSTQTEYPYIEQMFSGLDEAYKTIFKPEGSEGMRGTNALRPENPSNGEYWLAILLFFKELK